MAAKPTFIFWGQSNMEGYAPLSAVPAATFNRWTGQNALGTTYPISLTMPDVKVWTPKLPFTGTDTRNITASAATTIDVSGAALAASDVDSWLYIKTATVGQGQLRKITAVAGNQATVAAWTALPSVGGTVQLWDASHSANSATSTTIEKTATTPAFPGYTNKWVVIISGAGIGQARLISSNTATILTVSPAWDVTPSVGDGFVIYDQSGTVDTLATYTSANGAWRDLVFSYDQSYAYTTGFDYPNFKSWPRIGPILHLVGGATYNAMVEAAWQLQNHHGEPIYCIHLGIGASLMSPYHGTLGLANFSWFNESIHNDWHPSSTADLLQFLLETILPQAAGALSPGDTLDVRGILGLEGETDADNEERAALASVNLALIRDTMRAACANGFSTLSAEKIPFVNQKIRTTSGIWEFADTVNTAFDLLAHDDPYTGTIETDDVTVNVSDTAHYDGAATGQILVGQRLADAWLEVSERESDPTRPIEERPTLLAIRTQVLRRYEGQAASNDASTNRLNQFINDSLREVYNTLGDNAWFLRRTETLTTSTIYPNTLTLPRSAKRLLWIESQANPGRKVVWKGVSLTDQGRVNITLHDCGGSPYIAHFVQIPRDLTTDTDAILLPQDYLELVVVLTCKRLAETHGNAVIAGYYSGEIQRLWKYIKKDVLRYARMSQEAMTTVDAYDPWSNGPIPSGFRES